MAESEQDWRPSASLDTIRKRAALLQQIRAFFHARGVLEVETPILSATANTDPNIASYRLDSDDGGRYLQTSPEFAMKRLLAAGCGSIYQLCKVFRQGELGRYHNPEFSMLEWYRVGFDHHALMGEVAELLQGILAERVRDVIRITYREAFLAQTGFDPLAMSNDELVAAAARLGFTDVIGLGDDERDAWLELLFDQVVVPRLPRATIVFVHDYPASQAALARLRADEGVAERFEVYIDGIELANGFHELTDAAEQARRFQQDNALRAARDQQPLPVDQHLLDSLAAGLPDCAGVALGIDRLLMLLCGSESLDQVMAFDWPRA